MTDQQPPLHSSIVSMVSLAAGIASNHPAMGQCQLERLRQAGVPQHQIETVIEIARHIRDEASQKLDASFDELAHIGTKPKIEKGTPLDTKVNSSSCCTATPNGQSCC